MGIPGSQEVVAAGSSAPSRVGGRPGRLGGGTWPRGLQSPGEQLERTALGLQGARTPGSAPRSRPRLPSSSPTLGPTLPGIRQGRAEYKMATLQSALRAESGRPFVRRTRARARRPTKNSPDPSIFGSPDPGADARVPPRPAPRRAALNGDGRGVTEGNLLRYLPRARPPGPGQPPNLVTSPASITRLACVSAARLQVLLPQPPAFEWIQCRSERPPSFWARMGTHPQPGGSVPLGWDNFPSVPLTVLSTPAC